MLVCTCVVHRVVRAVVCHSVAIIWFAAGYVQRRAIAHQITVRVDAHGPHDSVDHGKIQSRKKMPKKELQLLRDWRGL